MSKEEMIDNINDEDFVIRILPFADDDGEWNGEIDISIMAFPNNPLSDDDYGSLMHFVKMMCSSVPVMEQEESIRNLINEYVLKVVDNDMEVDVELENKMGVEKENDGNVVHLTFNTKTGGNA